MYQSTKIITHSFTIPERLVRRFWNFTNVPIKFPKIYFLEVEYFVDCIFYFLSLAR